MSLMAITAALTATSAAVNSAGGAMNLAGKTWNTLDSGHKYIANSSLIDISKSSRVEPLTIVGGDCLHLDYLPDVLQSLSSIFAGYYLQALSFTASTAHVKAEKVLERLNPNRNFSINSLLSFESYKESEKSHKSDWRMAAESYAFRLPTTKNKRAIALEEARVESEMNSTKRVTFPEGDSYVISKEDFKLGNEAYEASPTGNSYNSDDLSNGIGTKDKHFERVFGKDAGYLSSSEKREAERIEEQRKQTAKKQLDEINKQIEREDKAAQDKLEKQQRLDKEAKREEERLEDREEKKKDKATSLASSAARELERQQDKANAINEKAFRQAKDIAANGTPSIQVTKDSIDQARELSDLSVGKMVSFVIGGGSDSMGNRLPDLPLSISFRLMVNSVPESTLQGLLCKGAMDNSFTERYHAWRAGRIEFIKDLIFCQDLIDETKKSMMDDKTNVHKEVITRVNNAKKFGLLSKNPSLNVASNLYVISEASAATIERQLGGKLSSPHIREKIFGQGYAMIICVINRQYERITFYHRGISASSDVSVKDIKISNKKSGPDVGDIMKAYMAGNSPTI